MVCSHDPGSLVHSSCLDTSVARGRSESPAMLVHGDLLVRSVGAVQINVSEVLFPDTLVTKTEWWSEAWLAR